MKAFLNSNLNSHSKLGFVSRNCKKFTNINAVKLLYTSLESVMTDRLQLFLPYIEILAFLKNNNALFVTGNGFYLTPGGPCPLSVTIAALNITCVIMFFY